MDLLLLVLSALPCDVQNLFGGFLFGVLGFFWLLLHLEATISEELSMTYRSSEL